MRRFKSDLISILVPYNGRDFSIALFRLLNGSFIYYRYYLDYNNGGCHSLKNNSQQNTVLGDVKPGEFSIRSGAAGTLYNASIEPQFKIRRTYMYASY